MCVMGLKLVIFVIDVPSSQILLGMVTSANAMMVSPKSMMNASQMQQVWATMTPPHVQ